MDFDGLKLHPLSLLSSRTYPASGSSAMLPLTPQNNWTATILFCGGTVRVVSDFRPFACTYLYFRTCNLINGVTPGISHSEYFGYLGMAFSWIHLLHRYQASSSCVNITPDLSNNWVTDDSLAQGRVMGNLVIMPNGKLFLVNGANTGNVSSQHSLVPFS